MKHGIWLKHLLVVVSLLAFCVGCCAKNRTPIRNCPQPSVEEVDSYGRLVNSVIKSEHRGYSHPYGASVNWTARMIGYCWPDVTPLER